MPYKLIDGVKFHYNQYGASERNMVLIPGYTSDMHDWDNYLEKLSKQYSVLTFDPQGIGKTEDNGQPLTVELMAEAIHNLCNELNIKNPIMVGFSMGGCIAQTIAIQYPKYSSKLVLIASVPCFSEQAKSYSEKLCLFRENNQFEEMTTFILDTCFSKKTLNTQRSQLKQLLLEVLPDSQNAIDQRRQVNALKAYNGAQTIDHITIPTTIVCATEDPYAPLEDCQDFADKLKHSELVILEDCGHAILVEKDAVVLNLLMNL